MAIFLLLVLWLLLSSILIKKLIADHLSINFLVNILVMMLKWKRLLMLMGLCLFLNTCEKEDDSSTLGWMEAEVLYHGVHGYRCYCCGGGILEIEGQRYLFKQFPEDAPEALQMLETDLLEPIKVQITYRIVDPCDYFEIVEVQNIQLN